MMVEQPKGQISNAVDDDMSNINIKISNWLKRIFQFRDSLNSALNEEILKIM